MRSRVLAESSGSGSLSIFTGLTLVGEGALSDPESSASITVPFATTAVAV